MAGKMAKHHQTRARERAGARQALHDKAQAQVWAYLGRYCPQQRELALAENQVAGIVEDQRNEDRENGREKPRRRNASYPFVWRVLRVSTLVSLWTLGFCSTLHLNVVQFSFPSR